MPANLEELIQTVLSPGHFLVLPPRQLHITEVPAETIRWELFRGRLLDGAHTRREQTFHSWNLFLVESESSPEPLLSLKWDKTNQKVHIVRSLLCHAWEGHAAPGDVILSRETIRWARELTGTVDLADFPDPAELQAELASRLFGAVVGLSRLPLTSVEAPLPEFCLGSFGYFPSSSFIPAMQRGANSLVREPINRARTSCHELLRGSLTAGQPWAEKARLLELLLRAATPEQLPELAALFIERWQEAGEELRALPALLRTLLNDVSLSPWTGLVDHLLRFLHLLVAAGALPGAGHVDYLSYTLRQIARHLTAYDLHTFHHRGANYPDALLLNAALKDYLGQIEAWPDLFLARPGDAEPDRQRKQQRRRALRQGWLLRRYYEGLPVPDAPTSPGENVRVLPAPHVRVPEEQILHPGRRRKFLYTDDPLDRHLGRQALAVLGQSIDDLQRLPDLRELGLGLFIDRPLGLLKAPAEPDQTLLFAHEAFSRAVARRRLAFLAENVPTPERYPWDSFRSALDQLPAPGRPASLWRREQHGVVSLSDAARAAEDFLLLRTIPGTVREFLRQYGVMDLARPEDRDWLGQAQEVLIVPLPGVPLPQVVLALYDGRMMPRLALRADLARGYRTRSGSESPAAGFTVSS
jgi:hypothetical protein